MPRCDTLRDALEAPQAQPTVLIISSPFILPLKVSLRSLHLLQSQSKQGHWEQACLALQPGLQIAAELLESGGAETNADLLVFEFFCIQLAAGWHLEQQVRNLLSFLVHTGIMPVEWRCALRRGVRLGAHPPDAGAHIGTAYHSSRPLSH
jgi:hypothetical protein